MREGWREGWREGARGGERRRAGVPGAQAHPGPGCPGSEEQGSLWYQPALSVCWEMDRTLFSHRVTIGLSRLFGHWELLEPADEVALIFLFWFDVLACSYQAPCRSRVVRLGLGGKRDSDSY